MAPFARGLGAALVALCAGTSAAAAQDAQALVGAVNSLRGAGVPALHASADLMAVATGVAMDTPAGPNRTLPVPDAEQVRQALVRRLYIPMQLDVLIALAGADPGAAAAVWAGQADSRFSVLNPALEEIGTAVTPNPRSTGPNDAYLWVALLARPLRTPAESADSPRSAAGH